MKIGIGTIVKIVSPQSHYWKSIGVVISAPDLLGYVDVQIPGPNSHHIITSIGVWGLKKLKRKIKVKSIKSCKPWSI